LEIGAEARNWLGEGDICWSLEKLALEAGAKSWRKELALGAGVRSWS